MTSPLPKGGRIGSTLTEVLVALMITSIGLVSVATLFPLSILRSIRATQLTSATDARYNAETAIDIYQNMIKNPINYTNSVAYLTANGGNLALADPPLTQNYVIDPVGFAAVAGLNNGNGLTIGNSAFLYQNRPEHWYGNDPSGGNLPPWNSNPPGAPWVDPTASPMFGVARYPMGWRTLAQARYLVTLPDSWPLQFDTVGGTLATDANLPAGSGATQITLAGLSYPTGTPPNPPLRVVMFSGDGQISQIRFVTALVPTATGTTVIWTEDIDAAGPNANTPLGTDPRDLNGNRVIDHYPLPTSFVGAGIGQVRLEAQDPRYTWMLTVRQSNPQTIPPSANVDVVVFFNRSMEDIGTDELLYNTQFALGSSQSTVTYPTGNNPATGKPLKPFMKKGGYVFDANNAFWYRISNVIDGAVGAGSASSTLTLEIPANAGNFNLNSPIPPRAMFPRGIVDVYPLGSKSFQ